MPMRFITAWAFVFHNLMPLFACLFQHPYLFRLANRPTATGAQNLELFPCRSSKISLLE